MRVDELIYPEVPEKFVELIDGELVVKAPAGRYHNRIAYRLQNLFESYCRSHPILDFGGDNEGFLIRKNPDTLLCPDACLFRRRPESTTTWMEFAPEVTVEVYSPSNTRPEMALKRRVLFDAGTEQFWLLDPAAKRLEIHYSDGRVRIAGNGEVISGDGIVDGMRIDLSEVFAPL